MGAAGFTDIGLFYQCQLKTNKKYEFSYKPHPLHQNFHSQLYSDN